MKQSKTQGKSINLAFYFAIIFGLIIFVSVAFKLVDLIKDSKYDGKHTFTVAIIKKSSTDIINVSPENSSLSKLSISKSLFGQQLVARGIPVDGYIKTDIDIDNNAKSAFFQAILHRRGESTNLTLIDLIRLAFFAGRVKGDNISLESTSLESANFQNLTGTLFVDPTIEREKESIQITNATNIPGLGNKMARLISNLGGNVVLVNSQPNRVKTSVIQYQSDSHTVRRLSKSLNLKKNKGKNNSISDITIVIGEDKEGF